MYDFFSAMPPDMLLRHVRERQAEVRDRVARARLAAQRTTAQTGASRPPRRPAALGRTGRHSPALGRLWSAFGRLDR